MLSFPAPITACGIKVSSGQCGANVYKPHTPLKEIQPVQHTHRLIMGYILTQYSIASKYGGLSNNMRNANNNSINKCILIKKHT